MKTLNFLLVISTVGGLLLSCDKSDDKPSDNIVFTEKLSADKSTLKIISFATNRAENKFTKAGQMPSAK